MSAYRTERQRRHSPARPRAVMIAQNSEGVSSRPSCRAVSATDNASCQHPALKQQPVWVEDKQGRGKGPKAGVTREGGNPNLINSDKSSPRLNHDLGAGGGRYEAHRGSPQREDEERLLGTLTTILGGPSLVRMSSNIAFQTLTNMHSPKTLDIPCCPHWYSCSEKTPSATRSLTIHL